MSNPNFLGPLLTIDMGSGNAAGSSGTQGDSHSGVEFTGRLQILPDLGFVSSVWDDRGRYGITDDPAAALIVSFVSDCESVEPFDIHTLNGPDPTFGLYGSVLGSQSTTADLVAGSTNQAWFVGVGPSVGARSAPALVPNAYNTLYGQSQLGESTIWRYSCNTQALVPTWVNSDGVPAKTSLTLVYPPSGKAGYMGMVGDAEAFATEFEVLTPVEGLKFVQEFADGAR